MAHEVTFIPGAVTGPEHAVPSQRVPEQGTTSASGARVAVVHERPRGHAAVSPFEFAVAVTEEPLRVARRRSSPAGAVKLMNMRSVSL